jgi:high-affinity nickel permease
MTRLLHLFSLLGFGFILGLKHSLDADHVAAVSTIISQTKNLKRSLLTGALWGIGHTASLLLVGVLILTLNLSIPDWLSATFECFVGVLLVLIGIDLLYKIVRNKVHLHRHRHVGLSHIHFHSHYYSSLHQHTHRSIIFGIMHGLAGSALLMILVLTTFKSVISGLLYILIFGTGSILGMLIVSTVLKLPFLISDKLENFNDSIKALSGTMSVTLGIVLMYKTGFPNNLFC